MCRNVYATFWRRRALHRNCLRALTSRSVRSAGSKGKRKLQVITMLSAVCIKTFTPETDVRSDVTAKTIVFHARRGIAASRCREYEIRFRGRDTSLPGRCSLRRARSCRRRDGIIVIMATDDRNVTRVGRARQTDSCTIGLLVATPENTNLLNITLGSVTL